MKMFTSVCEPLSDIFMMWWRQVLEVISYGETWVYVLELSALPKFLYCNPNLYLDGLKMRTWQGVGKLVLERD